MLFLLGLWPRLGAYKSENAHEKEKRRMLRLKGLPPDLACSMRSRSTRKRDDLFPRFLSTHLDYPHCSRFLASVRRLRIIQSLGALRRLIYYTWKPLSKYARAISAPCGSWIQSLFAPNVDDVCYIKHVEWLSSMSTFLWIVPKQEAQ